MLLFFRFLIADGYICGQVYIVTQAIFAGQLGKFRYNRF